ncbi:hypothetical protein PMIN07_006093 [Paraphaeosphaeria minitans]
MADASFYTIFIMLPNHQASLSLLIMYFIKPTFLFGWNIVVLVICPAQHDLSICCPGLLRFDPQIMLLGRGRLLVIAFWEPSSNRVICLHNSRSLNRTAKGGIESVRPVFAVLPISPCNVFLASTGTIEKSTTYPSNCCYPPNLP